MDAYRHKQEFEQHLMAVGLVCSQWAYLEFLFEITLWWILGLEPKEGRIITGGLSIETAAKRICDLAHLRIKDEADRDTLRNSPPRQGS